MYICTQKHNNNGPGRFPVKQKKTKDMANTITLRFTKQELDILYYALNHYALDNMKESKTWANAAAAMERGGDDVWAAAARQAGTIQDRVYDAQMKLEKKNK